MTAAPAAAAPSCAGTAFSLQGTRGSGVVAARVQEIKRQIIPAEEPEGTTFGHVISRRLAHVGCS
jgi:hypothetical protein